MCPIFAAIRYGQITYESAYKYFIFSVLKLVSLKMKV